MKKRKGRSYERRVAAVNAVYDRWARFGLSNREIWRRYIYPVFGIDESTMYRMLKAAAREDLGSRRELASEGFLFPELALESPNTQPVPPEGSGAVPLEFFKRTEH